MRHGSGNCQRGRLKRPPAAGKIKSRAAHAEGLTGFREGHVSQEKQDGQTQCHEKKRQVRRLIYNGPQCGKRHNALQPIIFQTENFRNREKIEIKRVRCSEPEESPQNMVSEKPRRNQQKSKTQPGQHDAPAEKKMVRSESIIGMIPV
ncbi:MAG TPA: hypothetical protein ACFCUC_05035 [Desulfobacterales bacterium]